MQLSSQNQSPQYFSNGGGWWGWARCADLESVFVFSISLCLCVRHAIDLMMSSLALYNWSENAKELTKWNYIWLCVESPEFLPFVIKSAKDVTLLMNNWLVTISSICRVLPFGKVCPVKVKNSTQREGLFILSTPFRSSNKAISTKVQDHILSYHQTTMQTVIGHCKITLLWPLPWTPLRRALRVM